MNATAITLISVIGTGLVSAFFVIVRMIFGLINKLISQMNQLEDKFTGQINQFEDKFTGLEDRVTGQLNRLEDKFDNLASDVRTLETTLTDKFTSELKALEHKLTDKFTSELRAQGQRIDRVYDVLLTHGERLTRIELKLDIDPPAEAA
ncbi:hypothetical protein [Candidatus Poriferisocius sp.]|uniref:hypothetical protein n=1 Tax=Candidatus Poriferisocius sp. TaxID=3101276 RepID=UPI003B5BDA3C